MIMKGQKISDRYQIIKSIGEGGMANVYLAYDTILNRNVAVKILRGDLSNDEKFVRRFQREALASSSLNHPNIVEVYDVGEDNGNYYIVMEYIEGKHLKNLLKKRGKLTLSEAVDIMIQIADGMSVAHDAYIIHRDIKPQNIMILENGLVKITDFGIAMAMNATQLTQTNSVMGSVHYLPPEQANGQGSTLQSDIYSMGIVMYELITGELPFKGDNAVEIALKHLKEPVPDIRNIVPNVPNSVVNIIKRATAKNPKNRYHDAREMYEDLKTCLDDARSQEEIITYEYSENDTDDTKLMKLVKKENKNKETKKEPKEEVVAKKVEMGSEKVKKSNKVVVMLAVIFTFLVLLITSLFLILSLIQGKKDESIIVPNIEGMSLQEAVKTLQDEGFNIAEDYVEEASTTVEEGKAIGTKPEVGTKRRKGTEVTIRVSIGDVQVEIEDYTGQNYYEIKGKLEALGLIVSLEAKDTNPDEEHDPYEIIGQSVEAGEKLSLGETIILYYSNSIVYPDFTDGTYTVEDVKEFAENYKLHLDIKYMTYTDNSYEDGQIVKQSRGKGTPVKDGASFTITVAQKDNSDENITDKCEELGLC